MRLVQNLQQKYTQHMNTITAQMNRDVREVQQQMYHLQQQVSNIETNARETANTLTQHFNDQIQQIYNELTTDISIVKQHKEPLIPRPQTEPTRPPPGFKPRPLNPPPTFTVPHVQSTHTSQSTQKETATATTSTYSQAAQRSPPPHVTLTRKRKMSSEPATKQVKIQRTSGTAFIADSTMKFLTEDKDYSLAYLVRQDMEQHIRLHRGKSAQEILSQTDFQQLQADGVTRAVVSFGTVDLLNMHQKQQTPEQVAQTVADAVNDFVITASLKQIQTLYIIPGYNKKITPAEFQQFENKMEEQLQSDSNNYIKLSDVMDTVAGDTLSSYHAIMDDVLQDGIHLQTYTGQVLLQTALKYFNIHWDLNRPYISAQYASVQKRVPTGCWTCGKPDHTKYECLEDRLHCKWCKSTGKHNELVCPNKHLPCTNCGQIGHTGRGRDSCPLNSKKQQPVDINKLSITDTDPNE